MADLCSGFSWQGGDESLRSTVGAVVDMVRKELLLNDWLGARNMDMRRSWWWLNLVLRLYGLLHVQRSESTVVWTAVEGGGTGFEAAIELKVFVPEI